MQRSVRGFAQMILAAAVAVGYGRAQEETSEKHVAQIIAESRVKHPAGAEESVLCQQAKAERPPYSHYHFREVNPATLEKDLPALMQKSDEVVLVGAILRVVSALSPSDADAVTYQDVRVLRTWKGSHKVGDRLTFAFPNASIRCGPNPEDVSGTVTGPGPENRWLLTWTYGFDGPYILFLRQDNTQLVEGLRLSGGDGMQGLFVVNHSDIRDEHSDLFACFRASIDHIACTDDNWVHRYPGFPECLDPHIDDGNIARCNAVLNASQKAVAIGFDHDPLREKYEGMPISSFLKEVQSAADLSGKAVPSADTK